MKQIFCVTPGRFTVNECKIPQPGPGEVLLKIRAVGVCGTDLHAYQGTQPFFTYPRILGHEIAAQVVTPGPGTTRFHQGDPVTVLPYFNCGSCIACRSGKPNCCTQIQVAGVHTDGAHQEYYVVKEPFLVAGKSLSIEQLALVEPLAIAAHGIYRTRIKPGEWVLIMGMGPIGLGLAAIAKIEGANVIGMDILPDRLQIAQKHFGVDYTIETGNHPDEAIRELTSGDYPTAVIDATGSQKAIEAGLQYLAHGGRYTLVGLQKEPFSFSHPEFHKRETTLQSSRNATLDDFQRVISWLENKLLKVEPMISHRIPFNQLTEQFPVLLLPESKTIKAIITFP